MSRNTQQTWAGERGSALLLVTLSLPVILGLIGLVVDVGWAYWRKEACKAAADSAALAGATAAYIASNQTCGSGVTCQSDTTCPASISGSTQDTALKACLWATQNGFTNGGNSGRQTVSVEANTTTSPVSGTGPGYWVSVTVSERNPLTFLSVLGSQWSTVSAKSTAGSFAQGGGCVYVLNSSKSGAYTQTNGIVNVSCNIYVNSSDSKAFTMNNGTINLNSNSNLIIHGGELKTNGTITPAGNVQTYQPAVADPFAGMTAPTPSLPAQPNPGSGTPGTIPAGTYSSISINNGSWTLGSGTFIITAGDFKVNNGTVNTAAGGATLYFPNGSGNFNISNGTMNLTAPSGTGIAIWKDGPSSSTAAWTNGTYNITGVIYMPYTALAYSNGSADQQQTIVVDTLTLSNGSIKKAAAAPLAGGMAGGAYLMQ